jgi:hypothetical protein
MRRRFSRVAVSTSRHAFIARCDTAAAFLSSPKRIAWQIPGEDFDVYE